MVPFASAIFLFFVVCLGVGEETAAFSLVLLVARRVAEEEGANVNNVIGREPSNKNVYIHILCICAHILIAQQVYNDDYITIIMATTLRTIIII